MNSSLLRFIVHVVRLLKKPKTFKNSVIQLYFISECIVSEHITLSNKQCPGILTLLLLRV